MYLMIILPIMFIQFYLLRNSIFSINFAKKNFTGIFFIMPLLVYILPSIGILYLTPASQFYSAFMVDQSLVPTISFNILLSYFILVLTLYIFFKIFRFYRFFSDNFVIINNHLLFKILIASIAIILFLISILYFFFGVEHSLILSLFGNNDLSQARSLIENDKFSRYCSYLIVSYCYISSIILGLLKNYSNKNLPHFIIIFISFLSLWGGSKSPAVTTLILYFISIISSRQKKIDLTSFLYQYFFAFFSILFVIYMLVLTQGILSDDSNFTDYIINRVFIGQMIGVYEQYSLKISNFDYFYNSIPFMSYFIDLPNFHKDLMMISESRVDPDNIGVKNSYFLSEASSWGLAFEVFWSPFFWGIGFASTIFIFSKFLQLFIINRMLSNFISTLFISSQINVTGGISEVIFLKFLVMQLLLFLPLYLLVKVLSFRKNICV